MGKRGPRPQPTELKRFEGNPGKRPLNPDEPQPPSAAADTPPPDWLGAIAREKWFELLPLLCEMRVFTAADTSALALLCDQWQILRDCDRELEQAGSAYYELRTGFIAQHPAVNRRAKAAALIRQLQADFGLNPSARSGLKANNQPKDASGGLMAFLSQAFIASDPPPLPGVIETELSQSDEPENEETPERPAVGFLEDDQPISETDGKPGA